MKHAVNCEVNSYRNIYIILVSLIYFCSQASQALPAYLVINVANLKLSVANDIHRPSNDGNEEAQVNFIFLLHKATVKLTNLDHYLSIISHTTHILHKMHKIQTYKQYSITIYFQTFNFQIFVIASRDLLTWWGQQKDQIQIPLSSSPVPILQLHLINDGGEEREGTIPL